MNHEMKGIADVGKGGLRLRILLIMVGGQCSASGDECESKQKQRHGGHLRALSVWLSDARSVRP